MKAYRTLLLALAAAALTLGALWQAHRAAFPPEATPAQVQEEARRGGYRLISTAELAARQRQDPNLLVVDTRQDWEYLSGHIRGAVNFPMEPTWWGSRRSRGSLAALLGPDKDRPLVFY